MHDIYPTIGSFKVKELENGMFALETTVCVVVSGRAAQATKENPNETRVIDQLDEDIDHAGQKIKQAFFAEAMRVLDRDHVLKVRHQCSSFQKRGTRAYTFKTSFGTVKCPLIRVRTSEGEIQSPSVQALHLPPGRYLTARLREQTCDLMLDVSVRKTAEQLEVQTGEKRILGRTEVWDIACAEGKKRSDAVEEQAKKTLEENPEAAAKLLTVVSSEEKALAVEEVEREDQVKETFALAEQAEPQAEDGGVEMSLISSSGSTDPVESQAEDNGVEMSPAIGFGGTDPYVLENAQERRRIDPGTVVVEADEVVAHAQKHTGKKRITEYTAVILTSFVAIHVCASCPEQLQRLVAARLIEVGLREGVHQLLFVCDGARWIRAWFAGLTFAGKAMVLCWYHLRKRCEQGLSMACYGRKHREEIEWVVLEHLWHGRVTEAIAFLENHQGEMRNRKALDELVGYLKDRTNHIPDYSVRQGHGLMIASTCVEKMNDWTVSQRCKGNGMAWNNGVHALASLKVDELNAGWKRIQELALGMAA